MTFHGGMAAIAYEWGATNHRKPNDRSPDEFAHKDVSEGMRAIAGGFREENPYRGR